MKILGSDFNMVNGRANSTDLKIKDIRGAVAYDPVPDYEKKAPSLLREFRLLTTEYRKKYGWRGPLRAKYDSPYDADTLKELADSGGEGAKLAAALAAQKDGLASDSQRLSVKCEVPEWQLVITNENVQWLFEDWERAIEAREVLEESLNLVTKAFDITEMTAFGIQFKTVFRLQIGQSNIDLMSGQLLPGLAQGDGFYSALGGNPDWRRVDVSGKYYRRNSELLTDVMLEAPGDTAWIR